MNLIDMLKNSMMTEESVEALSKKSGSTKEQTSSLLSLALPMLIGQLTQNASSSDGVASLANALTQHTDTSSMTQQFANADSNDGNAIISHILGSNSEAAVNGLAQQTNMESSMVSNILGNMAPGLMSGLSAATTSAQSAQQDDGFDFTDLLGAFGGGQTQQPSGGAGILGSLFGGGASDDSSNGSSLIGSLLGFLK